MRTAHLVIFQILAQVILLPALDASAAELPKPMSVVTSPGYQIFSGVNERRTREVLSELNSYHRLMEVYMNRKALPEPIPTRIFLLGRTDWRRYFGFRKGLVGLFVPTSFANYLLIDAGSSRDEYMPTIFHEYTHYFLHTQFPGDYPAWFDEGMAEVLSTAKFKGASATIHPQLNRVYEVQSRAWLPAAKMLRVDRDSPEYTQHKLASSFYSQSWLFMHYSLIENFDFGGNVFRYVGALNRPGTTIEQAIADNFGDEKQLDEMLKKYSNRESFKIAGLQLGSIAEPSIETPRALDSFETGLAIAQAAIGIGLATPGVIELIDALIASGPSERKGHVYSLRAHAAAFGEDAAAADRFATLATETISATDVDGYKALAKLVFAQSSTMADAKQQAEAVLRARELFETARELNGQDLEVCWGFGLTGLLADVETRVATETLAACLERAPRNAELNYAAAVGYSKIGKLQRMRDHLVDAIRYSRDSGERAQMRETLRSVDERLRAEGRLERAR